MLAEMVVLASYRHSCRSFIHAFPSGVLEIMFPPGRTPEGIPQSAYRGTLEANRHRVHLARYHEGFSGCKTTESDGL
ncbi:hypothetical protein PISMIDRAFT_9336 [Pisolithus microcarpus 441]|uniref:Uncharacterized protein n=1 Tax=Pisolithus microcarpus 441 TaxID=765257 RepID=A0A0C9Z913_9AGAM|nr:hypothetical protein PISMIDRAFT_9336 [Pisolithus microcarpus 441]